MKAFKTIATLSTLFVLSACDSSVRGTLTVTAPFQVKTVKGTLINVSPKTYSTTIKAQSNGARVYIHFPKGDVAFDIPKIAEKGSGSVSIPAARIRQQFALQGKVYVSREGFERSSTQSCVTHYETQSKCDWEKVCHIDRDGAHSCSDQYNCNNEQVPVYGSQDVTEAGYEEARVFDIGVVANGQTVAKFKGANNHKTRTTSSTPTSYCR